MSESHRRDCALVQDITGESECDCREAESLTKSFEWRGTKYHYGAEYFVQEDVSLGWDHQQLTDYKPPAWKSEQDPGSKRTYCLWFASGANGSGAAYGYVQYMVSRDLFIAEIDETGAAAERIAWHKEQAAKYDNDHPISMGHEHVAWSFERHIEEAEKVFQ